MRNPPPRCQSRVADGARLTDRPQGTGRPFSLRTPPAVELAASPMPNAGQKKSAGIEDGRWCALWFQAVKPGCGICRSGSMVLPALSGCQSDSSTVAARLDARPWLLMLPLCIHIRSQQEWGVSRITFLPNLPLLLCLNPCETHAVLFIALGGIIHAKGRARHLLLRCAFGGVAS